MRSLRRVLAMFMTTLLLACTTGKEGTVEGTVVPQGTPAGISAVQDGRTVRTVPLTGPDSRFRLQLAAGTYRIIATAASSTAYRAIDNIIVRPGETIVLPPIDLAIAQGRAVLSGRIFPPQPGSEVVLLHEGVERAAARTDTEGRYEFIELPAGTYDIQARSPGHAADTSRVVLRGDEKIDQTAVLLPIVDVNGVDWSAGTIRSTGTGRPPINAANTTVRRAMAERAALADGQRNLLRIIGQIRMDSRRTVQDAMAAGPTASRIQGFLKGYRVVSERDLEDGGVEVILELPLTGPGGLSRMLVE